MAPENWLLMAVIHLVLLGLAGRERTASDAEVFRESSRWDSTLTEVTLIGEEVTDGVLAYIKKSPRSSQLRKVGLSITSASDEGLLHLADLTQLSYLDLSQTKVTGVGLASLRGVVGHRLDTRRSSAISRLLSVGDDSRKWLGLLISPAGDDITARRTVYLRPWCMRFFGGERQAGGKSFSWIAIVQDSLYSGLRSLAVPQQRAVAGHGTDAERGCTSPPHLKSRAAQNSASTI